MIKNVEQQTTKKAEQGESRKSYFWPRIGVAIGIFAGLGAALFYLSIPHEYSFETAADIYEDSNIEVPPTAIDIHVIKDSVQHSAIFTCDLNDLEAWVAKMRGEKPELDAKPNNPNWLHEVDQFLREDVIADERELFVLRMGSDAGFSKHLLKYNVARSERGGNITVWHDPQNGHTYLFAVYR